MSGAETEVFVPFGFVLKVSATCQECKKMMISINQTIDSYVLSTMLALILSREHSHKLSKLTKLSKISKVFM